MVFPIVGYLGDESQIDEFENIARIVAYENHIKTLHPHNLYSPLPSTTASAPIKKNTKNDSTPKPINHIRGLM